MEDQFVIRVPESIKEKVKEDIKKGDVQKVSIKMISSKEGVLTYEGKTYSGYISDLPCIVESHKTLDNKQFIKVGEISKIFIFVDPGVNVQKILSEAMVSGLTPPMAYVRNRRFRKRLTKAPIIEEIEKEVNRLLNKDKEAIRVDVQVINKDGNDSEEDVSSLAAEIELNLLESEKQMNKTIATDTQENEELKKKESELKDVIAKIEEKKTQEKETPNVILKKRFLESIAALEKEKLQIEKDIQEIINNLSLKDN